MKTNQQFDATQYPAMVKALEGLAMLMMIAGAPKDEAIAASVSLFKAAHDEANLWELEVALGDAE
jgi:uncharacterized protein (DUF1810 family)